MCIYMLLEILQAYGPALKLVITPYSGATDVVTS